MSVPTFADLGVSSAVVACPRGPRHRTVLSRPGARWCPTSSPATTCSSSRRPARARRWPSAPRSSTASRPPTAARRRSSWPRPASSPRRSSTSSWPWPTPAPWAIAAVYGGVGIQRAGQARPATPTSSSRPRAASQDLIDRGDVRLDNVKVLVLDEADRMLDMGFRPAVDRIVKRCTRDRQTLLFSATLDGEVGRLADALHARRAPARARCTPSEAQGQGRAPLRARRPRGQGATGSSRSCAPRGRAARSSSSAPSAAPTGSSSACGSHDVTAVAMHGNKSPEPAREGAGALRGGQGRHARGHRRRRPRHRRAGHHARHQLRRAGGPRGLRPPRRAHRPRRAPPASASRSSSTTRSREVSKMAGDLGLHRELSAAGLSDGGATSPTRRNGARPPQQRRRRDGSGNRRRYDKMLGA